MRLERTNTGFGSRCFFNAQGDHRIRRRSPDRDQAVIVVGMLPVWPRHVDAVGRSIPDSVGVASLGFAEIHDGLSG